MRLSESDLREFFETYARTFHEDISRFCDLYYFPSATVRLDGTVQFFHAKEDAMHFFTRAKQRYEEDGCAHWRIRRLAAEQLGSGSASATIDWDMLKADQSPIRGWRQTYNVIGSTSHWKVLHSTLHMGSELGYGNGA
ncbi:MAG: hypothetical protein ING31_11025 [Burkholderiales bacterium]|jgi:hypothetical protein|nr:hypothetical protein [Burkholderiales bacterium]MCA3173746.1 hypothetical protein [Burkholderiales bacterium]